MNNIIDLTQPCEICICGMLKKKCICKFGGDFDLHFREYNDYLSKKPDKHIISPIRPTLMVFDFSLSHVGIDFSIVEKHFKPSIFLFRLKNNSKGKKSRNKNVNNRMYNTLMFDGFLDIGNGRLSSLSIRMFHNGSIGVSGCKTMQQCKDVMTKVLNFLQNLPEDPFIYRDVFAHRRSDVTIKFSAKKKKPVHLKNVCFRADIDPITKRVWKIESEGKIYDFIDSYESTSKKIRKRIRKNQVYIKTKKVNSINASFAVHGLYLFKLHQILDQDKYYADFGGRIISMEYGDRNSISVTYVPGDIDIENTKTMYTRNSHLKYPRQVRMIIYSTGSIMILGAVDSHAIFEVYTFILGIVHENSELLDNGKRQAPKTSKTTNIEDIEWEVRTNIQKMQKMDRLEEIITKFKQRKYLYKLKDEIK